MSRALAFALLAATSACGPDLRGLVEERHLREAICGATDGWAGDRATVGAALDVDADPLVHVTLVPAAQIARVLGEPAAPPDLQLARIELQTNLLPVDAVDAQIALVAGPRVFALPVSWDALAQVTGERLPAPHVRTTYITFGNLLRASAAIVTAGASLSATHFSQRAYTVDAPDEEYAASAPHAHALFHAMPAGGCRALGEAESAGARCTWFVVLTPHAGDVASEARLEVVTRYTAKRVEPPGRLYVDQCTVERRTTVALGSPRALGATTATLFGTAMRRLAELAQRR